MSLLNRPIAICDRMLVLDEVLPLMWKRPRRDHIFRVRGGLKGLAQKGNPPITNLKPLSTSDIVCSFMPNTAVYAYRSEPHSTMTERISTTAPTIGDKPWYHYPVGDIPDDTLRHIVSSFNERFNQAALSSRENYAANTFLPAYNKVVRAWEQEPNIYPTQLPVAEVPPYPATPHPSRIEFFRVVYDLLDRKPTCIEDHLNAELAAQRAIEWFVECKIPHVNGPEVSLEIKTWGADELYRHIWGADGEGPLGRLRSVVGKSVSIDGIEYKIHACFTATEDIDPVYELHAVDSPQDKRYVPLPELENLMGRIIL